MAGQAKGLSEADVIELGAFYASLSCTAGRVLRRLLHPRARRSCGGGRPPWRRGGGQAVIPCGLTLAGFGEAYLSGARGPRDQKVAVGSQAMARTREAFETIP